MKQKKWDELHKELDKALDSKFSFENAKLALRKYISDNKEKVADDLNEMKRKSKTKIMKTEKKKAGRPGKNKSRDFLTQNEIITAKNEIIADLEARLDFAYKEQEDMLKELDRNLNMVKYHCQQVEANTGELIQEDIAYCANLVNRIMEHKFGYKPQTQEL